MENNADILLIQQYLEGKLSPGQMHELENQALDDPFLADALEGYAHAVNPVNSQLSILQRQLEERIAAQHEEKNIFHFTWQRLSIAAAAGLMFISAGILFWMNSHKENKQIAVVKVSKPNNPVTKDNVAVAEADTIEYPLANNEKAVRQAPANLPKRAVSKKPSNEVQTGLESAARRPAEETFASPGLSEMAILGKQQSSLQGRIPVPGDQATDLQTRPVSGKVISKADSTPLPGVSIRIRGGSFATNTNANGEYTLPDSIKGTIDVAFLGFASKEIPVKPGEKPLIVLDVNGSALSEVVVTRGNAGKKELSKSLEASAVATPDIGWEKYNEYLKNNLRYPKPALQRTEKVTVTFTVDDKGRMAGFRVLKSLTPYCDDEAIRLVKRGPKWVPAPQGQLLFASVGVVFKKPLK